MSLAKTDQFPPLPIHAAVSEVQKTSTNIPHRYTECGQVRSETLQRFTVTIIIAAAIIHALKGCMRRVPPLPTDGGAPYNREQGSVPAGNVAGTRLCGC